MTGRVRAAPIGAAVERLAATGIDDRALREQILAVIRRSVPFDAYAFLLTDPVTTVGCSPVADVPDLATLPELIRLKYLTPTNRWTQLPARGCASLVPVTESAEGSLPWRRYLARLGIVDVLSVVFADRFGCWGFLDLWRLGSAFSADEVAALSDARAAITARLRGVQVACLTAAGPRRGHHGPAALVLSPTLEVRARTPQTQEWLAALLPSSTGQAGPVPAGAYNVAAQLLATEAGIDSHPAQARVHLGGGTWLTLRADRLAGSETVQGRDIVVTMEESSPAERRDLFSRAHGLTGREDELLGHLAGGVDTRTVAGLMSISELTVQDHLKAVFSKTSTSSRRELIARSLGQ